MLHGDACISRIYSRNRIDMRHTISVVASFEISVEFKAWSTDNGSRIYIVCVGATRTM